MAVESEMFSALFLNEPIWLNFITKLLHYKTNSFNNLGSPLLLRSRSIDIDMHILADGHSWIDSGSNQDLGHKHVGDFNVTQLKTPTSNNNWTPATSLKRHKNCDSMIDLKDSIQTYIIFLLI